MTLNQARRGALAVILLISSGANNATAAVLGPGYSLHIGQRLYSANGQYYAALQADGNLSVHRRDGSVNWSTQTSGSGAARVVVQRDGNVVLVDREARCIWSTRTQGRHRVLGVSNWGSLVVINAKKWKPRHKWAEPMIEDMLTHRSKLAWQSPSPDNLARHRPPDNKRKRLRGTSTRQ